jgi:CRP-like cAMP-binding protein
MAAAAPAEFAKLLFRTEPFNQMDSARRFQLLSQARSVRFAKGEQLFPENQPPAEVCILLEGNVCVFADLPGEKEPVMLEGVGPGSCVGWISALSGTAGLKALATTEAAGLFIAAPMFLEAVRHDPTLKEAIYKQPRKGEIWRAVAAEIERRKLGVGSPRQIVERLTDACIARDWPEEQSAIEADTSRIWIVSGGEGVTCGERWKGGSGVLWARLIGLPVEQFGRSLAVNRANPPRETLKLFRTSSASRVVKKDSAQSTSEYSESRVVKEKKVSKARNRGGFRVAVFALLALVVLLAGVVTWARRQPVNESLAIQSTLVFSGESRNMSAVIEGTLLEMRIHAGQRIERGTVIAVIRPMFDEARARELAATRERSRQHAEFCESIIAGRSVRINGVPQELTDLAREHAALLSELRVQTAIQRGGADVAGLSVDERKRVTAYFSALRENQSESAISTARDRDARREDLREAEEALREAQSEMRVQSEAYSQLRAEKNDEAREEYAVAQRALAALRRGVSQKQEVVNRIRKEIAAMSITTEPEKKDTAQRSELLENTNTALASIENRLREQSTMLRELAMESDRTLTQMHTDNGPREIQVAQRGLVVETAPVQKGTLVKSDTFLGRLVTHQSWRVQCPSSLAARLESRQSIMLVVTNNDGTTTQLSEILDFASVPDAKEQTLLRLQASRDDWHDGMPVRIEATVTTGTLLDQWLSQVGMAR